MKKSDWALIILIFVITFALVWFIVPQFIPQPSENPQTVQSAAKISQDVPKYTGKDEDGKKINTLLNPDIFKDAAINPTISTAIEQQNNQNPIISAGQ